MGKLKEKLKWFWKRLKQGLIKVKKFPKDLLHALPQKVRPAVVEALAGGLCATIIGVLSLTFSLGTSHFLTLAAALAAGRWAWEPLSSKLRKLLKS